VGVEPDPIQEEKNRKAEAEPRLSFVEAKATELPAEDNSVDGVFFFHSLHHVSLADMGGAMAEAARVLKPESGFLYVVEPSLQGEHSLLMRHFHDETEERNAAQAALALAEADLFSETAQYEYLEHTRFDDFEAFIERVTGATYNDIARANMETDGVRAMFEAGKTDAGNYTFNQPEFVTLFRGAL
jgi:ubiquinone/menaquinone biosynthesis C-methylase UbiE